MGANASGLSVQHFEMDLNQTGENGSYLLDTAVRIRSRAGWREILNEKHRRSNRHSGPIRIGVFGANLRDFLSAVLHGSDKPGALVSKEKPLFSNGRALKRFTNLFDLSQSARRIVPGTNFIRDEGVHGIKPVCPIEHPVSTRSDSRHLGREEMRWVKR